MEFTENLVEIGSLDEHTIRTILETTTEGTTTFLIIFSHGLSNIEEIICKGELRPIPAIKNVK